MNRGVQHPKDRAEKKEERIRVSSLRGGDGCAPNTKGPLGEWCASNPETKPSIVSKLVHSKIGSFLFLFLSFFFFFFLTPWRINVRRHWYRSSSFSSYAQLAERLLSIRLILLLPTDSHQRNLGRLKLRATSKRHRHPGRSGRPHNGHSNFGVPLFFSSLFARMFLITFLFFFSFFFFFLLNSVRSTCVRWVYRNVNCFLCVSTAMCIYVRMNNTACMCVCVCRWMCVSLCEEIHRNMPRENRCRVRSFLTVSYYAESAKCDSRISVARVTR